MIRKWLASEGSSQAQYIWENQWRVPNYVICKQNPCQKLSTLVEAEIWLYDEMLTVRTMDMRRQPL